MDIINLDQFSQVMIGRDSGNQLHLDHPIVSKKHARITHSTRGYIISDLGSINGTYVNGYRLKSRSAHLLRDGDVILIGPARFVYNRRVLERHSHDGRYQIDVKNVHKVVVPGVKERVKGVFDRFGQKRSAQPQVILENISFSVRPYELVALVGGSGAGKSTLMKVMVGNPPYSGEVLLNKDNLQANYASYRSIIGYVPQDDIIHSELTLVRALRYAARLRLPDASREELRQRIGNVLAEVELDDQADKQIKSLSGGQRKRASIAVELLADPPLLFLDEPTSGLDPGLDKKLMILLRRLADSGRTVVLVTHATTNIEVCHHVAFLLHGQLVYFGPPKDALHYFRVSDYAEIYSLLSEPESTPNDWARRFRSSPKYHYNVQQRLQGTSRATRAPASSTSRQAAPFWHQFQVLVQRNLELILRDRTSLMILLAVMPLIGFLLLLITESHDLVGLEPLMVAAELQQALDDQRAATIEGTFDPIQASYMVVGAAQRLLFMIALAATLLGLFSSYTQIINEEAIYLRERMVNLELAPYLLAKWCVLGGFALLQCFLLLFVLNIGVLFPENGIILPAALELYISLVLAALASISLGLLISAMVPSKSSNALVYVVMLVLFVQILFAGALFDLSPSVRPLSYLTTTRWTLEALGSTTDMFELRAGGVMCLEPTDAATRLVFSEAAPPCAEGQQRLTPPYEFSVSYAHEQNALLTRWAVLASFSALFGFLTYLGQKRKDMP
jgi:ABC transport system ATP-binding/permease protein